MELRIFQALLMTSRIPSETKFDPSPVSPTTYLVLAGLMGSKVTVTLEVQADVPAGVPEKIVRTVTENCRTLKFKDQGFEES